MPTSPRWRGSRPGFGYCFETPPGSEYPPIANAHLIEAGEPVTIEGKGGALTALPITQMHGRITSLAFRFGGLAYSPDASGFDAEAERQLAGLDVWILDALRPRPHPSHLSLSEALEWIERAEAEARDPDPHARRPRLRDAAPRAAAECRAGL